MPRTKAPKKVNKKISNDEEKTGDALLLEGFIQKELDALQDAKASLISSVLEENRRLEMQQATLIPKKWKNQTVSAVINDPMFSVLMASTRANNTTNLMGTEKKIKTRSSSRGASRRSLSVGQDEGYLTSETSSIASSGRMSRARSKGPPKSTRVSRSVSRNNGPTYKTPLGKRIITGNDFTVTPKVKLNTPQVILRRPMQGEMALSLSGSPLLTTALPSEAANVNIPLSDGRCISIQAQRGIRMSQLPALDAETLAQLEMLKENLNKVCALQRK